MVKRRVVVTAITGFACLFIGIIASFQYTNYVDRRSNQYWCGIVTLFNETYKENPPPTATGKILQHEFEVLGKKYKCT